MSKHPKAIDRFSVNPIKLIVTGGEGCWRQWWKEVEGGQGTYIKNPWTKAIAGEILMWEMG